MERTTMECGKKKPADINADEGLFLAEVDFSANARELVNVDRIRDYVESPEFQR